MKQILNRLFDGELLSKGEAEKILLSIGRGDQDPYQIAAFLTCFQMRPITGQELSGFRSAMIQLAKPVDLSGYDTIDLCGTGGDGKDTFNISTVSAFVVAGAGYKVAKHGNYGVSSGCGSSNVLEHLGYWFTNDQDRLRSDLENGNFCYMHAQLFHPAMKEVGPIRKGMQVKTFFNMLGPLLNPSKPGRQITGVYSDHLIPLYKTVFEDIGSEYAIIHSVDGYDEISLTGDFLIESKKGTQKLQPEEIHLPRLDRIDLYGGNTVEKAAEIFVNILKGNGTEAQNAVVAANAGLAIQRFKPEISLIDCIAEAKESIMSLKAYDCLKAVAD
ncbi:MAG: anthranilate phosphoribosyltransferase [Bacteroidia bacterium]|nr:anthranilate phosphoribosyltransferase [Bacteroidia bacterium]